MFLKKQVMSLVTNQNFDNPKFEHTDECKAKFSTTSPYINKVNKIKRAFELDGDIIPQNNIKQ